MFTITSTRIVGLIAVVCAAIVAPQALAMPIIDSQDTTPTILIAPPGNEPRGLDLGDLKNGRALFTATTPKNVKATTFVYTPTNPGWGAAATAAKKFAAKPASEPAVKTAPAVCLGLAEYDYGYTVCEWWS